MKLTLVIMAAGMGSRYGDLKQMATVDCANHRLMDYSLYDARQAGFEKALFIITPAMESDFVAQIVQPLSSKMEVDYVFQTLSDLPEGFTLPKERNKPWGTAHAVYCARKKIQGPFAVINADDYYGPKGFQKVFSFLCNTADKEHHAMVGYHLENTLSENGQVSRGICQVDRNNQLIKIVERTKIKPAPGGATYSVEPKEEVFLPNGTIVSMNLWGFGYEMLEEISNRFPIFLTEALKTNPLTAEYYLPSVPDQLIQEKKAEITVLSTTDRWYGLTFPEDMPMVQKAILEMQQQGIYPDRF